MNDLISRQAAIDALDKRFDSIPMEQTTEILLLRKDLRELPSAEPERKKGHWIRHDEIKNVYGGICIECSECGLRVFIYAKGNYCPNCGAKMKGGTE